MSCLMSETSCGSGHCRAMKRFSEGSSGRTWSMNHRLSQTSSTVAVISRPLQQGWAVPFAGMVYEHVRFGNRFAATARRYSRPASAISFLNFGKADNRENTAAAITRPFSTSLSQCTLHTMRLSPNSMPRRISAEDLSGATEARSIPQPKPTALWPDG